MQRLIASLPSRVGQTPEGKIHIVNSRIGIALENICTKKQVAALKEKNWIPYNWKDGENEGENIYTGSHDTDEENYTTASPRATLTATPQGKWILSVNAQEVERGHCWIDWNGNNTYEKGEKIAEFQSLMERPRTSATLTLYGKYSELKCAENALPVLTFSEVPTWLQELIAQDNKLTAIDLKGATALTTLNLDNNKLSTLDLAGLPYLSTLNCFGNGLATLQVGNNTKLRSLFCNNTQLQELNVRNNKELEVLYCLNNKLTALDLSETPLLSILNCSVNAIEKLNLEKNTELTKLYANDNKLSSLSLQNHTLLAFVDCANNQLSSLLFKGNKALLKLHCNNNKLTTLDLAPLPALEILVCSDNALNALSLLPLAPYSKGFAASTTSSMR